MILLPVAQLEIADSGVNCPWYLLFALFWAALSRPATRAEMAAAAAVGFFTAASTTMSVVFAPLLLARVIALPRRREHAVTAGSAAGCLLQVPYVVSNLGGAQSRAAHPVATPGPVLAFYGHEVVLPALGWHLAWWLQAFAGRNGATLIVGAVLVAFFGWALAGDPGVRAGRLVTGFLAAAFGATLKPGVITTPVSLNFESGSRYTALPIFLIEAAIIVSVGSYTSRRAGTGCGPSWRSRRWSRSCRPAGSPTSGIRAGEAARSTGRRWRPRGCTRASARRTVSSTCRPEPASTRRRPPSPVPACAASDGPARPAAPGRPGSEPEAGQPARFGGQGTVAERGSRR